MKAPITSESVYAINRTLLAMGEVRNPEAQNLLKISKRRQMK